MIKGDWRDSEGLRAMYFNWAKLQPSIGGDYVWIDSAGYWWNGDGKSLGSIFCLQQLSSKFLILLEPIRPQSSTRGFYIVFMVLNSLA